MGNLENIGMILMLISIPAFIIGLIVLIVQAIRKKKKKPALLIMLISVIMLAGGFLLPIGGYIAEEIPTSPAKISEDEIEAELEDTVWADASVYCMFEYKDVKHVSTNIATIRNDGDIYHVYGKVTIQDNFNDKYYGNFEGTYRLTGNEFSKIELNIETPRKG